MHMYVHKKGGGDKSRTSLRQEAGNRVGGNGNREGRKEGRREREGREGERDGTSLCLLAVEATATVTATTLTR